MPMSSPVLREAVAEVLRNMKPMLDDLVGEEVLNPWGNFGALSGEILRAITLLRVEGSRANEMHRTSLLALGEGRLDPPRKPTGQVMFRRQQEVRSPTHTSSSLWTHSHPVPLSPLTCHSLLSRSTPASQAMLHEISSLVAEKGAPRQCLHADTIVLPCPQYPGVHMEPL